MSKMVGQDMLAGMGFIGTKPGMYRMTPPYTFGEAEGTAISVESKAGPLKGLRVMGRTEQERTTGAQLFEPISNKLNKNGITITFDENGEKIVVSGTTELSQEIKISKPIQMQAGEKYVLTLDEVHYFENIWLQGNGVRFGWIGKNTRNMVIITVPDSIAERTDCVMYASASKGKAYNFTINHLMLNAGGTPLQWEPYTGGKPSPSPDYPQELVSVGDGGSVGVSVTDGTEDNVQSITLATPNALPGIPVTDESLANYTDADGQMWCCDEVDLERGVYVQRVLCDRVRSEGSWNYSSITKRFYKNDNRYICAKKVNAYNPDGYCSSFRKTTLTADSLGSNLEFSYINQVTNGFAYRYDAASGDVNAWKSFLDENDIYVLGILATPIETPLSAAELAAYRALRSNKPVTTIMNSDNAHMKVKYRR